MRLIVLTATIIFLNGCTNSKLPNEKYYQYNHATSFTIEDNQLKVTLENPLHCPLRFWIFDKDEELQQKFNSINPIELKPKSDTLLIFSTINDADVQLRFSSRLGSTSKKIDSLTFTLPFPKNKSYKVIQGNNSNFTHNTDWSRYAVDFSLRTGDTICSASSGFVVGVIDQYKDGGRGKEWKPFANFITIYEPNSGIFTQYVHLEKNGSLVQLGDQIESGQPIALSGNTGQSDGEHLHFNCLVPVNSNAGLKSFPFKFVSGLKSTDLMKGDVLRK